MASAKRHLHLVVFHTGTFLAGIAFAFAAIQTRAFSFGAGDPSSGLASCDPGFRLPVSRTVMYAIDAVLGGLIGAACIPVYNILAAIPSNLGRFLVLLLTVEVLSNGFFVAFSPLPACAVTSGAGLASCDPGFCLPVSRAVAYAVDVAVIGITVMLCIDIYKFVADEEEASGATSKDEYIAIHDDPEAYPAGGKN